MNDAIHYFQYKSTTQQKQAFCRNNCPQSQQKTERTFSWAQIWRRKASSVTRNICGPEIVKVSRHKVGDYPQFTLWCFPKFANISGSKKMGSWNLLETDIHRWDLNLEKNEESFVPQIPYDTRTIHTCTDTLCGLFAHLWTCINNRRTTRNSRSAQTRRNRQKTAAWNWEEAKHNSAICRWGKIHALN